MAETETKTDIIWNASYQAFRDDIAGRVARITKHLGSLKNQSGLFAEEHRRLIQMYGDVLKVIDQHK